MILKNEEKECLDRFRREEECRPKLLFSVEKGNMRIEKL
jgi:hypothetical protein